MRITSSKITLAPTDLSNFLGCRHLTSLDLSALKSGEKRPARYGPMIDALRERGIAHEKAYLETLRGEGLSISEGGEEELTTDSIGRTEKAMADGVDIVFQAALSDDTWSGRADFLRKVDTPSDLGAWSYEPIDTKLAQDTKAGTILQLCVYAYLLGKRQGKVPEHMHVATPRDGGTLETYRTDDYAAYFRLLERGVGQFISEPAETYPEMVSNCDICAWWDNCEKRRRGDDHLCYVAGISKQQIQWLKEIGIEKLADLAALDEVPKPSTGSLEALLRTRDQARAQWQGRETGTPYYELKEPFDEEHGLALLPEPTPDDIFLDFEGSHFADEGVQEYLTGYVTKNEDGTFNYTSLWATTLEQEQQAFEQFMDFAMATRKKNPGAHIYHFASYETVALKRLMGRFASKDTELDALLRGGAFIDLLGVTKRALIAAVENYSIKNLEQFFGYERQQDLRLASMSRRILEAALEAGDVDDVFAKHRQNIEDYNREDCESTSRLRDWLEQLRAEVIEQGHELLRPVPDDGEASEKVSELDAQLHALRDALLEGVPLDPDERSAEEWAKFKLAHMMEFHRREDKAAWWEKFRLQELDIEDYLDERRALTGLQFVEVVEDGRAPVHRYTYVQQDVDARRGEDMFDDLGDRLGGIVDVDIAASTIDVRKMIKTADHHPTHGFFFNKVSAKTLQQSLIRLGQAVIDKGLNPGDPYRAAAQLLLRNPPKGGEPGKSLQHANETTVAAACRIGNTLNGEVLAIQGPPGTGKTFTGGEMICELIKQGKRVGVTAVSHKVIVNLLEGAMKAAQEKGISINCAHKKDGDYQGNHAIRYIGGYPQILNGLESGEINLLGGTAWQWSREDFAQSVDVLFVDEAGQMSLSNVLATAQAANSLVLLGDPQQLEQPLQSSHPEGSEVSALHHLLDGEETMPPDQGLFLGITWRLHPDIAQFTSEAYYANRLEALPGLEKQEIRGKGELTGSGLRFVPVEHTGNQARSLEEVDAIANIVEQLTNGAVTWRDKEGQEHPLTRSEILVVAPYNSQVAALAEKMPAMARRIGTVDKFQGQEAPIVVYSMTSSSPEDAPRGMEFLYNPNRFNVATSRAKAMCILVGSPALFEPECRSPKQMRMANGFCRYVEFA
jgi:uncharacterized protein